MRIPIKNKFLEIKLCISIVPNIKKLEKELSDFFDKNDIQGHKIKKFHIDNERIIPEDPYLEEELSKGDYQKELEEIGKKYGINHFGFVYYCYHK